MDFGKIKNEYTIGEIIQSFFIKTAYIIIPFFTFIITLIIQKSFLDLNTLTNETINNLATAFMTISGILPGILLSFIGNIANMPDNNTFVKNIKEQKYEGILYNIIFTDITLLIISLILSIIITVKPIDITVMITVAVFSSAVTLFIHCLSLLNKIISYSSK